MEASILNITSQKAASAREIPVHRTESSSEQLLSGGNFSAQEQIFNYRIRMQMQSMQNHQSPIRRTGPDHGTDRSQTDTAKTEERNSSAWKKWNTQAGNCLKLVEESGRPLWEEGMPADRYLAGIFRDARHYGSRDRAFFSETFFAFLRWRGWLLKHFGQNHLHERGKLPSVLCAALAAEGMRFPACGIWLEQTGRKEEEFAEILLLDSPRDRFQAFTHCPVSWEELVPAWTLGEFAFPPGESFLKQLQTRPPVWIRMQTPDRERFLAALGKENTSFICQHEHARNAFRFSRIRNNLRSLPAFRNGLFEFQDFASQCIGLACGAKPGERWWDTCAGGGGKTLQLLSMTAPGGRVAASDIREYKLEEMKLRAERAGFRHIDSFRWDGTENIPEFENYAPFDGILVDAPCSSSGRWRRNPEARWTLTREKLGELNRIQKRLLSAAAEALRPGGTLVYATCSLFRRENEAVVHEFLSRHAEFHPDPFPSPVSGERTDGMLQILPENADCDGAFVARMKKKV